MYTARSGDDAVVRMVDGEDLVEGLRGLSDGGALILSAIGMLCKVRLGYWNGESYEERAVAEPTELVSLQGNLAVQDGKPIVHCHLCIARRNGSLAGGHLIAATVYNTAEIALRFPQGIVLERCIEPSGLAGLYPRST